MEYQALYRKYRPQRFDEVVGQEHVTHTIAREVVEQKIAHAYLFAGPRGTGKTTTARLLAKALNCADRADSGEPDNECASCVAITEGTSLDVIELDAASHNKVEDVREIRVNVGTVAATAGSRRVYILDEAHMLSRAAGNALLKTLEEPPEHVVFVLATTEPYKLLDTIRSRSQRFDFHPVPSERLIEHLGVIAAKESIDADGGALAMIAGHAGGSVRDAMSLLEQVAALGDGTVRREVVTRALGLADRDAFAGLAASIVAGDAPRALGVVAELASRGADLRRFVAEGVEFFRGIFLAQYAPNLEEVVDEPADVIAEWRRYAADLAPAEVLRAVDVLGEALMQLRQGREERLVIELALLRLTRPETSHDAESLAVRVDRLERLVRDLEAQPPQPGAASSPRHGADWKPTDAFGTTADPEPSTPAVVDETPAETGIGARGAGGSDRTAPADDESRPVADGGEPGVADIDLEAFARAWPAIVAQVRETAGAVRHALVKVAEPVSVEEGTAVLAIPERMPFHLEQLRENRELIAQMEAFAAERLGGPITISFVAGEEEVVAEEPEPMRAPDKTELTEAGEDTADPTTMVVDILGGEIVSD
jgi:DNA polymerase-3 subunit gamma/tau